MRRQCLQSSSSSSSMPTSDFHANAFREVVSGSSISARSGAFENETVSNTSKRSELRMIASEASASRQMQVYTQAGHHMSTSQLSQMQQTSQAAYQMNTGQSSHQAQADINPAQMHISRAAQQMDISQPSQMNISQPAPLSQSVSMASANSDDEMVCGDDFQAKRRRIGTGDEKTSKE
ncbi:unnamed protein product [Amoebophrya sp. A25]|nr:unnamed protein product [Amoebophrya sp. A25]|eukprot:GSA25T00018723001.1